MNRSLSFGLAASLVLLPWATADAQISASINKAPSAMTEYNGDEANGFLIVEDVAWDPFAGAWIKRLINCSSNCGHVGGGPGPTGFPILSGQRVGITEVLTNTGPAAWTDWHEIIRTDTIIGMNNPQRGFLFDKNNTLRLMADYGGGFQALNEFADYTVMGMDPMGPGSGENMGWEAIWIFFEPHAVIRTGDRLKIEKQIFEVFGDANIWEPLEFVEIAQYPTIPEPASLVLAAAGLGFLVWRRQRM